MSSAVASALAGIYMLSEIGLGILKHANSNESQLIDRGSLALLWTVNVFSVTLGFALESMLPALTLGDLAAPARLLGVTLFVVGLAIRWYAIIYLGRFFTVNLAIAKDHKLIDAGPYRYIRHPSYTGALTAFLGLGLCLGNWASLAVVSVPTFLVFLRRMRVEEAALLLGLGNQYQDYMKRTKQLIPGIY
jgi:protein-S-isoprenylcysteine O-methyltransferase